MASFPKDIPCPGGCGRLIEKRVSLCRPCYFKSTSKAKRNKQICRDYTVNLLTVGEIAEKYGISVPRAYDLLSEHHAKIDPELKKQRMAAKRARSARKGGRPPVWPDCPPHLREQYDRMRRIYGYRSADARDVLLEEERRSALKAA